MSWKSPSYFSSAWIDTKWSWCIYNYAGVCRFMFFCLSLFCCLVGCDNFLLSALFASSSLEMSHNSIEKTHKTSKSNVDFTDSLPTRRTYTTLNSAGTGFLTCLKSLDRSWRSMQLQEIVIALIRLTSSYKKKLQRYELNHRLNRVDSRILSIFVHVQQYLSQILRLKFAESLNTSRFEIWYSFLNFTNF